MSVGYGHLLVLNRKQLLEKNRKAEFRDGLQKRKESYLKDYPGSHAELEFPKVSKTQLEIIKLDIRLKATKQFIKKTIIDGFAYIAVMILVFYWFSHIAKNF